MIGENNPHNLAILFGINAIIILIISIFIQRYFIRKGTNIFINILCVFLWFAILIMILTITIDLFLNDKDLEIISETLYWLFYICGFVVIDQLRTYMINGNFTFITKIISIIKFMAIFIIIFMIIGFIFKWILKLCIYLLGEQNALIITINIITTIISMPMLIAYLMFLGCGLWEVPRDLFMKFHYPTRIRKLCWEITHAMRKYKDETEFIIISINKIKLTQEKIITLSIETLKNKIKEAKQSMDSETNKEQKKEKKKIYDDLNGFKELYKCEKEMKEMMKNLKKTADFFKLNYEIDIPNSDVEIKELKNKNELVDINAKYKIYKDQIFRINYQKYSIYKEWAEIKSFILLRNSNENSIENNKTKDKNNIQVDKNENIDITNVNENNNKYCIENSETISNLKNSKNFEVNNGNNYNQEKSEIKRIKDKNPQDDFEFRKLVLPKKTIIYYKIMPIISYILILICIAYDVIIIFGQVEFTFKLDIFSGKVLRWFLTNTYMITPLKLFPFYFTLFVVAYSFGTIKSDMTFCVYAPRQTEPCHMLFFVGMLTKFICPLCFNYIKILFNNVDLKGNGSSLASYFEKQFGYLNDPDNVVIYIAKIALFLLFLKAICCTASRCYGNFAYKKNQYLTFHSTYEGKESEILMGELILNKLNKSYGNDLNKLKIDNIFEYEKKK